jgi:xanthosine utilization system XapX-like protein
VRIVQIGFAMVIGLVYIGVKMANPEMGSMAVWGLRLGVLVLLSGFFVLTNLLSGRAADASPLQEEEVPSLNLAGRAPREAEPASGASDASAS